MLAVWALAVTGALAQSDSGSDAPSGRPSQAQTREQLEELRARMARVQASLEADRSARSDVENRIEALDREIASLAGNLRRIEREQAALRDEIARLNDRSEELRHKLAAHKETVASLAYSTYVMGRQSHLKLFLNQQDPSVVNRMMGYHDYIVAARSRTIERINAWSAEIAGLAAERRARKNELQSLGEQFLAEQESVQARRRERESALAALDERIAGSKDELVRLKENEARLEQVLEEIQDYLADDEARRLTEGAFREMQGKMKLPVSAPIGSGFGQRRETGVRWDGIMFRPEAGADVNAIFQGQVVFADWLRGFGLLLIVDHGGGYMSLYSHNESLFKQVGDWVDTGEVIATVGTSGGLDRPGLYFEIRHQGEPQNPLSWCQKA